MDLQSALLAAGWSFNATATYKKEKELKQGENSYQASLCQIHEVSTMSALVNFVLSQLPINPLLNVAQVCNSALPYAGVVLLPTSAMIKQGHYQQGVKCFSAMTEKKFQRLANIFPEEISVNTTQFFSTLSDNASTITNTGIVVSVIAMPFLGMGSFAAGMVLPLVYQAMESANMINPSVRLAVENYAPVMINASLLAGGGLIAKSTALLSLCSYIPGASNFTQRKMESLFQKMVSTTSLEEIDAPWKTNKKLSSFEINYIMENHDDKLYEINVSHCSKPLENFMTLPKSYEFAELLSLAEKFPWIERYNTLKAAFRDDDRFLKLLNDKYPNVQNDYRENFEDYIDRWATELNITKEEFMVRQFFEQINNCVSILSKEKMAEGYASDLQDGIESSAYIIAYLLHKVSKGELNDIETEDILIKLAVEGGDYCARGIKRTTSEILAGIVAQGNAENDPDKDYELKIFQSLLFRRQQILQNMYQKLIEAIARLSKEGTGVWISRESQTTDAHAVAIAQDVHTMDLYRKYLSLGFFPLTDNERFHFGVADFATWTLYKQLRDQMFLDYKFSLEEAIQEHGELYFCNYIRKKIVDFQLPKEEEELLIEKLYYCYEDETSLRSFHRLFFVMHGILKLKETIYADWGDVSNPSPSDDEIDEAELSEWSLVD